MAVLLTKEQKVNNNGGSSSFNFKLEVIENKTDTASNTSNLTVNLYAKHNNNSGYKQISGPKASISVDSNQKVNVDVKEIYGSNYKLIAVWIGDIPHDNDGRKIVSVNVAYTPNTSYQYASRACTFNESVTLSNIARKSDFTASNALIGGACNISINRATNFTHTLLYSFGNLSGTIATGVATTYGWTIPINFYEQIKNSKTGVCIITCITYNGNVEIGRISKNITISVNETLCKPDVDGMIEDINDKTIALTGDSSKLIRYKNIAKITTSGTAKNSATIKSLLVDGYSSPLVVNGVSKNSFTITAIDSRDISASIIKTAEMVDYIPLTCSVLFERKEPTSNEITYKLSGNYFDGSFGDTDNALNISWAYRKSGSAEWILGGDIIPNIEDNIFNASGSCGKLLTYKDNIEFMLYYSDKLDSLSVMQEVKKGQGSLEIYEESLVSNGETLFHWEDDEVTPGDWLKSIYPVGSIYLSVNNTNPSTLFGGTWERFANGRVLVGVDETQTEFNAVQKTGGHKELQSHNHTFNGNVGNASLTGKFGEVYSGTNIYKEGMVSNKTDGINRAYSSAGTGGNTWSTWEIDASHSHTLNGTIGNAGNGNAGNLQPYITCYMWLRTA